VELTLALGKVRSVAQAQQEARDGLRDRARLKGLPPNRQSPYGMQWQDQRLIPDQNYSVTCQIWRLALEGETLRGIAKQLTQQRTPAPRGGRVWSATSTGSILANRTYAGVMEVLKTKALTQKNRRQATYGKANAQSRPANQCLWKGCLRSQQSALRSLSGLNSAANTTSSLLPKHQTSRDLLRGRIKCALCGKVHSNLTREKRKPRPSGPPTEAKSARMCSSKNWKLFRTDAEKLKGGGIECFPNWRC